LQEKVSKEWMDLLADIKAAIAKGLKPESAEGQALADRWDKLIEGFTGGHAGIREGVGKVWANAGKLPGEMQRNMQPFKEAINSEVTNYIAKAKAAKVKAQNK
jgi:hypothetical protein